MDELIRFGSAEACAVLHYVGASKWYEATCIGGYKSADAYYQAGVIFWICVALGLAAILFLLRKAIAYAFA